VRKHLGVVAGIVSCATVIMGLASPASAVDVASAAPPSAVEPAAALVAIQLAPALDATSAAKAITFTALQVRSTYTLESGSLVVLTRPLSGGAQVTPQFSVGVGWGFYVYLNRVDQAAVIAGGAAALAAAICLVPAVGNGMCAVVIGLVAAAAVYLDAYGKCPTSKPRLELDTNSNPRCIK